MLHDDAPTTGGVNLAHIDGTMIGDKADGVGQRRAANVLEEEEEFLFVDDHISAASRAFC